MHSSSTASSYAEKADYEKRACPSCMRSVSSNAPPCAACRRRRAAAPMGRTRVTRALGDKLRGAEPPGEHPELPLGIRGAIHAIAPRLIGGLEHHLRTGTPCPLAVRIDVVDEDVYCRMQRTQCTG